MVVVVVTGGATEGVTNLLACEERMLQRLAGRETLRWVDHQKLGDLHSRTPYNQLHSSNYVTSIIYAHVFHMMYVATRAVWNNQNQSVRIYMTFLHN